MHMRGAPSALLVLLLLGVTLPAGSVGRQKAPLPRKWLERSVLEDDGYAEARKGGPKGEAAPRRRRRRDTQRRVWTACHARLVAEVQAAEEKGGSEVVLYGDSIFESWRGTFMGSTWTEFAATQQVFQETFGALGASVQVAAIAGDTVLKLAWRLRNAQVAVVLVGTNDLSGSACTSATAPGRVADELEGLLSNLHRLLPHTQLVAVAILPKGSTWPNSCSQAIIAVNRRTRAFAQRHPEFMHYLDVGAQFLTPKGKGGRQELVPSLMSSDTLHPSFYGMRVLAKELTAVIGELLASA